MLQKHRVQIWAIFFKGRVTLASKPELSSYLFICWFNTTLLTCRFYGGMSRKNIGSKLNWVLGWTFSIDPYHGPQGGFPLTMVVAKHNTGPQSSTILSRGSSSAVLWPHGSLPCYYLRGTNLLDFIFDDIHCGWIEKGKSWWLVQ